MKTPKQEPSAQLCHTLLMSRPAKERSVLSVIGAALFHAGVIGLAVLLTSSTHRAAAAPDETFNLLPIPQTDEPAPVPPARSQVPAAPQPQPPFGYKTLAPPTYIPKDIPPVMAGPETDLRDYLGIGVENGSGAGRRDTKVTAEDIDKVVQFVPRTVNP
jgi:hypothetical protein